MLTMLNAKDFSYGFVFLVIFYVKYALTSLENRSTIAITDSIVPNGKLNSPIRENIIASVDA